MATSLPVVDSLGPRSALERREIDKVNGRGELSGSGTGNDGWRRIPDVPPTSAPFGPTATILASAATVAALYLGRDVLIPLALAILLSFALGPLVTWLHRRGVPRVACRPARQHSIQDSPSHEVRSPCRLPRFLRTARPVESSAVKTPSLLLSLSTFVIALVCAALLVVSPPDAAQTTQLHLATTSLL